MTFLSPAISLFTNIQPWNLLLYFLSHRRPIIVSFHQPKIRGVFLFHKLKDSNDSQGHAGVGDCSKSTHKAFDHFSLSTKSPLALVKFILKKISSLKNLDETWITRASLSCFLIVQSAMLLIGRLWFQDVTVPNKIIWIVDILGPKWPKMFKANLQPGFWLAIVVNNSSLFHSLNIGIVLITQAKHLPRGINWVNMAFECNQCRR